MAKDISNSVNKTQPLKKRDSNKRAKAISQSKIAEVLERYKLGQTGTVIAGETGLSVSTVYSIKKRYKEDLNTALTIKNKVNIDNYESELSNSLKRNILLCSNSINNYNYNKASLNQLIYAMGIMFDKLRLMEGKSTVNIANNVINSLNPEQLAIINDSIKSLKESILINDKQ